MKKQILFVDDEPLVLQSLRRMLRGQERLWEATFVDDPLRAWDQLLETRFDAVVCDVRMPGLSGLELLKRIGQTPQTRDTPVVMLSGLPDFGLKRQAMDLGAVDLLNKPVEREDLLARLHSVLRLKAYQDELRACNQRLEELVEERTEELLRSRLDIIWRLGKAAEYRDEEAGNHVIRVGCFSRAIAEAMGLGREFVELLFLAAPLHDIGKIGIPDAVLLKRGPLGPGQAVLMRQHCVIGAQILREDSKVRAVFLEWRGASSHGEVESFQNPFLEMAATIAVSHHEKWDGSGYPQGLSGEQIPLESRIVAVCDVFDAMTSRRPYKDPYPEDKALAILCAEAGRHFDPAVHAAFVRVLPELRSVRERFRDEAPKAPASVAAPAEEELLCR